MKVKKNETLNSLKDSWELTLDAFKSAVFPLKATQGKGLQLLTPKQMFQGLAIALAQVNAGKIYEYHISEYHIFLVSSKRNYKCITI